MTNCLLLSENEEFVSNVMLVKVWEVSQRAEFLRLDQRRKKDEDEQMEFEEETRVSLAKITSMLLKTPGTPHAHTHIHTYTYTHSTHTHTHTHTHIYGPGIGQTFEDEPTDPLRVWLGFR